MITIEKLTDEIQKARNFAIENNIENLDIDLQLFNDGTWKFHIRKEYQPDGIGYWSSTWIEPEDDDEGCRESAMALIANLNISNNDQLYKQILDLLCDKRK